MSIIDSKGHNQVTILVNSFAQNRITMDELINWFESQDNQLKKDTLIQTWHFLQNTRPTQEEINEGINNSEQKDTYTAAVLLRRFNLKEAQHKIFALPDSELSKTFIYVVSIFKTSDTRRRTLACKNQCQHFWHNL